ncbi:hypothetical protein M2323_002061 [Rhodoblastus acidophilus]|uniref:hypothetical protein n=1 Tax=Rhodoblastus acidophilus TaxID=1074 RepID=UPI002224DF2E|nr:hypothetical protein [Rhodoblastus acidophilus]MCW2284390.1 hypothetical protein [Rhodoblastus acidophilus]MCW2333132.1 hypothetical protein [Rhodoblastus acidophilus]
MLLFPLALAPASAQQAPDPDPPMSTGAPESDFVKPRNLFQIAPQYQIQDADPRNVATYTLRMRMDRRVELDAGWTLGLRADARLIDKNPINSANPTGEFISGLGDTDAQAALVRQLDDRVRAGVGVRIYAPTGGDQFGSGKWQVMPGAAIRYDLPEISAASYFEPLVRYAQSFAGDPNRRTISNLQLSPTVNFGLPNRWFFVLYPSPEIRLNFGDPLNGQTGRLFLPLDFKIGKNINDQFTISVEASAPIVRNYPVYNFKTALYIDVRY